MKVINPGCHDRHFRHPLRITTQKKNKNKNKNCISNNNLQLVGLVLPPSTVNHFHFTSLIESVLSSQLPRLDTLTFHLHSSASCTYRVPKAYSRWANLGKPEKKKKTHCLPISSFLSYATPVIKTCGVISHIILQLTYVFSFTNRQELVAWLNSLTQLQVQKVEQCGTG